MHSLQIPRAVGLIAGGVWNGSTDALVLDVSAKHDDRDWQIVQSPFMRDNARTLEFHHTITLDADTLVYAQTTVVNIYGKRFEHTDQNTLSKAGG